MSEEKPTLYSILGATFPQFCDHTGELNFAMIGRELGRTRQAMHVSIWQNNKLTADQVRHLISISDGKLTAEQMLPFIS